MSPLPGMGRTLAEILPQPTNRRGDLLTAIQAGKRAADPTSLTDRQRKVLANLARAGEDGLTDFQHPGIQQTSAGKRRHELACSGLVANSGRTRVNEYGNPATVWTITAEGIDALRGSGEVAA